MNNKSFEDIFSQARTVAEAILNKIEQTVTDSVPKSVEDLKFDIERLEAKVLALQETNDDLTAVVKVLLDGEVRKEVTMTWERYHNLLDSDLSVVYTEPSNKEVTVEIRQEL